ncbi:MAG: hypothetical protein JWQ54_2415 [Mucilaginibacter sp.]|nr:hypothetical protein [Mucilaginibacter sp.]
MALIYNNNITMQININPIKIYEQSKFTDGQIKNIFINCIWFTAAKIKLL